jgi:hypothetical protein
LRVEKASHLGLAFWVEFKTLFHGNCPSMELIFEWNRIESTIMTDRRAKK